MDYYRKVNRVPTSILCFGKGIDHNLSDVEYVVIVFPGNPGVIEYYREFMASLYLDLKNKYPNIVIPVWGVSHAGHQLTDDLSQKLPSLNDNSTLFDLGGQTDHKLEFISDYVPKNVKIIAIGHSIGCKIWMDVLRRDSTMEKRLEEYFMLFPTIQYMRETPNGVTFMSRSKMMAFGTTYLWPLLYFLLPIFLQDFLLKLYFRVSREVEVSSSCAVPATHYLLKPPSLRRSYVMAKNEMEFVRELDTDILRRHLTKIQIYFGASDGWCPLEYTVTIREQLPGVSAVICSDDIDHAFVLKSSEKMAEMISRRVSLGS